jgi:leucyl-tRNA synthetase
MATKTNSADSPPAGAREESARFRYNAVLAGQIELRWQAWWEQHGTFRTPNPGESGFDASRPKFYCLDMFPYPSGAGLHVGHPEGYTATDIICRYKRMRGCNVLHPMGWDAFGLPAEQYAIQTGVHPAKTTRKAIDNFRRQLKRFGFSYDWSREFGTIDEGYYRWTQWVFLQIYNSWFDHERQRARPIAELIEEFKSGKRVVRLNQMATEYAGAGDMPGGTNVGEWADLDDETRRMLVDSYRLAYVSRQTVNWCPKLGTALANEEVIDGKSERGGYPVFRKPMRQWMFRITAYSDRLLDGLAGVDWPESTKALQANWIGRSEGAEIDFAVVDEDGTPMGPAVRVFTTRPDTIFGATYMVVAPEHPLVDEAVEMGAHGVDEAALRDYVHRARNRPDIERMEGKDKSGCFTGMYVRNPATGHPIPVWTSDYVLMGYGTGAIMAVPAHDERDFEFATRFGLPIVTVVAPAGGTIPADPPAGPMVEPGVGCNSSNQQVSLDGVPTAEAKRVIIAWLTTREVGMRKVNYRLRDWLFSRQRYWGEPFPIVWDSRGAHHPVAEDRLPVRLPDMADYAPEESEDPQPLLVKAADWLETTACQAGVLGLDPATPLTREANTMPGWAGSCWYYLRYCDPENRARFVGREAEAYWMRGSVDLYVGGAEHAVLHLLYARFWHKVLFDLGHVSTDEPFKKLFHQGLITSHAFQRADRSLLAVDEVDPAEDGGFVERATGRPVTQIVAKMSKSLKNVVNPDEVIEQFGADTFRLYEMYMGPLEASKPWNTNDTIGLYRFLQRAWRLVVDEESGAMKLRGAPDGAVEKLLHRTIAKVGADIEKLAFNTGIAAMIEFVNAATGAGGLTADQLDRFARILSPFAPHLGEELWHRLGHTTSVAHAPWPEHDGAMLRDDEIEIAVQLSGKVRAKLLVPADADARRLEEIALADPKVRELLEGKTVRKVIAVPGRLVNIVAS